MEVKFKLQPPETDDPDTELLKFKCMTCGEVVTSEEMGHARKHGATTLRVDAGLGEKYYTNEFRKGNN